MDIKQKTEIYTLNGKEQKLIGFNPKYHNIVDYILKITEEIWENRAIWVINETYEKEVIMHVGNRTLYGVDSVIMGTIDTLQSFPDRKMNGETVIWEQDNDNTFFSSHRIGSTGTNTGDTPYCVATGKKLFFRTVADCAVRENKIFEEWLVRDNLHLIEQLGVDAHLMAKKDTRYTNTEHRLKSTFIKESFENIQRKGQNAVLVYNLFKDFWKNTEDGKLLGYHKNAVLHGVGEKDYRGENIIQGYFQKLKKSFDKRMVNLERITLAETEKGTEVAARWYIKGEYTGNGIVGNTPKKTVHLPIINHYLIIDGQIVEEWMVFDGFDLLCQLYQDIKPTKEETIHLINKKTVLDFFYQLNDNRGEEDNISNVHKQFLADQVVLNVTKPFNEMVGVTEWLSKFWLPLLEAVPDLQIQPYIHLGGNYKGNNCVSSTGNFIGTFNNAWMGIPATKEPIWIRFASHFIVKDGKITNAWFFIDTLDVIRQAGFNLFPNKGIERVAPAPMTGDGIVSYLTSDKESSLSMKLTNNMLEGLGEYDGNSLESMGQERFWDLENMMWYGPSGIGTTRGLKGFQDKHQIPFLIAFPTRGITEKNEQLFFAQYGDGNYSVDFGFPSMYGEHLGDRWLGLSATGKKITLHVMDFWRREGEILKENWVFIDMVDALEQLGVDVFDELNKKIC